MDLSKLGVREVKNVSKKTLVEGIIRPRLNEIFTMARLDLEKANLANGIPSGIVITGGGSMTVGAEVAAKRMMSLPARIGNPKGVTGLIDDIINPAFSTPVGLVLYGADQEPSESFASITKKFKLPSKGVFGNLVDKAKDLLP